MIYHSLDTKEYEFEVLRIKIKSTKALDLSLGREYKKNKTYNVTLIMFVECNICK